MCERSGSAHVNQPIQFFSAEDIKTVLLDGYLFDVSFRVWIK